jgi:hypothetical protein
LGGIYIRERNRLQKYEKRKKKKRRLIPKDEWGVLKISAHLRWS